MPLIAALFALLSLSALATVAVASPASAPEVASTALAPILLPASISTAGAHLVPGSVISTAAPFAFATPRRALTVTSVSAASAAAAATASAAAAATSAASPAPAAAEAPDAAAAAASSGSVLSALAPSYLVSKLSSLFDRWEDEEAGTAPPSQSHPSAAAPSPAAAIAAGKGRVVAPVVQWVAVDAIVAAAASASSTLDCSGSAYVNRDGDSSGDGSGAGFVLTVTRAPAAAVAALDAAPLPLWLKSALAAPLVRYAVIAPAAVTLAAARWLAVDALWWLWAAPYTSLRVTVSSSQPVVVFAAPFSVVAAATAAAAAVSRSSSASSATAGVGADAAIAQREAALAVLRAVSRYALFCDDFDTVAADSAALQVSGTDSQQQQQQQQAQAQAGSSFALSSLWYALPFTGSRPEPSTAAAAAASESAAASARSASRFSGAFELAPGLWERSAPWSRTRLFTALSHSLWPVIAELGLPPLSAADAATALAAAAATSSPAADPASAPAAALVAAAVAAKGELALYDALLASLAPSGAAQASGSSAAGVGAFVAHPVSGYQCTVALPYPPSRATIALLRARVPGAAAAAGAAEAAADEGGLALGVVPVAALGAAFANLDAGAVFADAVERNKAHQLVIDTAAAGAAAVANAVTAVSIGGAAGDGDAAVSMVAHDLTVAFSPLQFPADRNARAGASTAAGPVAVLADTFALVRTLAGAALLFAAPRLAAARSAYITAAGALGAFAALNLAIVLLLYFVPGT